MCVFSFGGARAGGACLLVLFAQPRRHQRVPVPHAAAPPRQRRQRAHHGRDVRGVGLVREDEQRGAARRGGAAACSHVREHLRQSEEVVWTWWRRWRRRRRRRWRWRWRPCEDEEEVVLEVVKVEVVEEEELEDVEKVARAQGGAQHRVDARVALLDRISPP